MYRTDIVTPAPDQLGRRLRPDRVAAVQGQDHRLRQPDLHRGRGALPQGATSPSLGITDPYELTQAQFDAAVDLLKAQQPVGRRVLVALRRRDRQLHQGTIVVGTTWPYQVNTLLRRRRAGRRRSCPSEGMTGWADTWMMSTNAKHPNCMLKWMAWMLTPEVQAQVAEYFGEAPANPRRARSSTRSTAVRAQGLLHRSTASTTEPTTRSIAFWKTPPADCGDAAARPASTTPSGRRPGPRSRADRGRFDGRSGDGPSAGHRPSSDRDRRHEPPCRAAARSSGCRRPLATAPLSAHRPRPSSRSSWPPPVGWIAVVYLGSLAILLVSRLLVPRPDHLGRRPRLQPRQLPAPWSTDRSTGRSRCGRSACGRR